jgi:biopolymer transport protein TolR
MAFGGGKAEMNVTPLIDVLLVLLIIFMLIVPLSPSGYRASIPHQDLSGNALPEPRTVVIQVYGNTDETSQVKINDEQVAWEDLKTRLLQIYKYRVEKVIFVRADPQIGFEQVARAIDIVHAAGIENVGLMK